MMQPSKLIQPEIIIRPRSPWNFVNLRELWDYRELFYILSWRDIKVRYKQTALGIFWVLFQPLISMVIFTIFFGNLAQIPSDSLPYPIFVLLGLTYWGFFSNALSRASGSFIENEQLVKKIYFPREILPLSAVVTAFVDFAISAVMFLIALAIYQLPLNGLFILLLIVGAIIAALASAGLGLLLASINIKYRDVRYIIPFFLQLLIFITPVIYPLNMVRPSFQHLLALNPMTGIIDALRSSLATGVIAHPFMLMLSITSAITFLVIGIVYFRKTERYFADII